MNEPPPELGDADVLDAVDRHWPEHRVDRVEHLPVGFGAHHWRASAGLRPVLFVTYDRLGPAGDTAGITGSGHDATSLEAAYAAAADLAFRLDVVVAGLPSEALTYTVAVGAGALSVTPWVVGERPPLEPGPTLALLARLHAASPPRRLPRWTPLPVRDLDLTGPWAGPLGEPARELLRGHQGDVRRWAERHRELAARSDDVPWVVTHGEPHERNQLLTVVRLLLVDWESVRLAPRERDLVHLARAGHDVVGPAGADPAVLELFDLEWRLDEVRQHAARFAAPHPGDADDRVALAGLRAELERP